MESSKDVVRMKYIGEETLKLPLVSNHNSVVAKSTSNKWGWLPMLSVTCALGIFLVALAAEAGRVSSVWAEPLFWLGLLVLFVPVTVRIISPKPARQERIALIVLLGMFLTLFRDLEQPLAFSFNDEFPQWRTALDIASSGHLFQPNPILSISPLYPGLQIVTNALSSLTGLSIFVASLIVLDVAALLLMLSLYLFYEYLGGSTLVAGIAMLLYMAKPTFFEDTLYHYEDLAIPLMAFVLFVTIHRSYTSGRKHRIGLTLIIWFGIAAVVITHHVASYMLVLFLLIWTVIFLFLKIKASLSRNRGKNVWVSPGGVALIGLILVAAWSAFTGARVVSYLFPTIQTTLNQFTQILSGQSTARQAFSSSTGYVEPLWERLTTYASVGLISLGLPFGLFQIWRHYRANAAVLTLGVIALAYPAILIMRLTNAGVNLGGRAQPYVFEAIVFVLAVFIVKFFVSHMPNWRYSVPLTGVLVIIFVGGWILGTTPDWNRLPGSYLPFADQRSIQPQSVTAAEWIGTHISPGHLLIGDHVNELLMGTYGGQWLVADIPLAPVFTEPSVDPYVEMLLKRGGVQFIVVDNRLVLPGLGWYDGVGSPDTANPIQAGALSKFDGVQGMDRIFDNGDITIYSVRSLTTESPTTPGSTPQSLCMQSTPISGSYPKVAKNYSGTIYDVSTGLQTNIILTSIQQQQGAICGYYGGMPTKGFFTGIPENGPFAGTITTGKQLKFSITNDKKNMTFSFEGFIHPDSSISGTYCGMKSGTNQCSDYGLWSVSPPK